MTPPIPTPFLISFRSSEIDRMMAKVRDHRLPSAPILPGASWDYGLDLDWLKELKKTWENEWSWEQTEKELNRFPHFRVDIEDLSIHFIHVKSKHPGAIPIVLIHGWPSSFLEFVGVIDPLVDPPEGVQAFDVCVPSLPGYTFSSPPTRAWSAADTSRVFNTLMVEVLGYKTYGAVGGDLGTRVITGLLQNHASNVKAAHYTMLFGTPPSSIFDYLPLPAFVVNWYKNLGVTEKEKEAAKSQERFMKDGSGYRYLQQTKPSTIGLSLYDNPVGILAYIGDKFHEWSDPIAPSLPSHITSSHIITQTALYHLTNCIHTSFLPYRDYSSPNGGAAIPYNVKAPIGYSANPHDIHHFPKSWLNKALDNLVFYRLHSRGGHFAAQDAPEDFLEDVREMMGTHFPRA